MRALIAAADWSPRKDYEPSEQESHTRIARNASKVWKHPRIEAKEIPVPAPKPDEALIQVKACGICGSDIHLFRADSDGYVEYPATARFPNIPGHEFSGVVVEVGRQVQNLHIGDVVAPCNVIYCGTCTFCRNGYPNCCDNMKEFGFTINGAMAEYAVINEKACWLVDELTNVFRDEDTVFEAGALVEPTAVAYNALFVNGGGFSPGAYVVVYGAGPIGLAAAALSKVSGASKVISVDIVDARLTLAKEVGADSVLNSKTITESGGKLWKEIMDVTGGYGADIQIEATGVPFQLVEDMERVVAVNSKIIQVGRAHERIALDTEVLVARQAALLGSNGQAGSGIFQHVIRLMAGGRLDMTKVITDRVGLENGIGAIANPDVRSGKTIIVF
jgi:threonine dehydrogenase-like Zn-dependent dehydrogenase